MKQLCQMSLVTKGVTGHPRRNDLHCLQVLDQSKIYVHQVNLPSARFSKSFSLVSSFSPLSFSPNLLPEVGEMGVSEGKGEDEVAGEGEEETSSVEGAIETPKFASIHSFSCIAICRATPSTLFRDSSLISFSKAWSLFLAHIVCKTPFFPAVRAVAPSSGG